MQSVGPSTQIKPIQTPLAAYCIHSKTTTLRCSAFAPYVRTYTRTRTRTEDELVLRRANVLQRLLDDVVPIRINAQLHRRGLEGLPDQAHLVGGVARLDQLLDGPGAVQVVRRGDEVAGDLLDDVGLLLRGGLHDDLLEEVVPERVVHHGLEVRQRLVEDHLEDGGLVQVELFLQEAAAVLIC